jgi:hypothetical protein
MRTTLNIDDDVLAVVKKLAANRKTSVGKILSELARTALLSSGGGRKRRYRNGVPLFNFPRNPGDTIVTMELVNRLRDED